MSKQIAGVTDQKVEYSKHKGLADKKCEALLLDSLKDHNSLTKQEVVNLLCDVFFNSAAKIQKCFASAKYNIVYSADCCCF